MQRERNRNINNFDLQSEFLKELPSPDRIYNSSEIYQPKNTQEDHFCFGEQVIPGNYKCKNYRDALQLHKVFLHTSSEECDQVSNEIIDLGASSSSSLSWSEEFDTAATYQVQEEFNRMQRVLCGLESIPDYYDHEEYKQWITTFPHLRLQDDPTRYPKLTRISSIQNRENSGSGCFNSSDSCDKEATSSPSELIKLDDVKSAVIEDILQNVSSRLFGDKTIDTSNCTKEHRSVFRRKICERDHVTTNNEIDNKNSIEDHFDSFLRISPMLLKQSSGRTYLDDRHRSSRSVARSDMLSSKWMQEDMYDFTSLPYLPGTSAKTKPSKLVKQNYANSNKLLDTKKLVPPHKSYHISLPPIKNLTLPLSQYRSISATPRQPNKISPNKTSAHLGSLLQNRKPPHKVINTSLITSGSTKRKHSLADQKQYL